MIALIGSLFVAASVALTAFGLARSRAAAATHRGTIEALADTAGGAQSSFASRGLQDRAGRSFLAGVGRHLTPRGYAVATRSAIDRAGDARTVDQILATKAGLAGGAALFAVLCGASKPGVGLFVGVATIPASFFWPDVRLQRHARDRAKQIRVALPDALDLMAILVEAGVGLEGAIARAAEDATGPLAEELHRVLDEMSLGSSRREAFQALRSRVDCPELSAFVLALLQADKLGIAVGTVLRTQAGEMRSKRRQRAREQAAKTPVKILFPLVFGIFPALLAVILGPAVLRIAQTVFVSQ